MLDEVLHEVKNKETAASSGDSEEVHRLFRVLTCQSTIP